MKDRWLDVLVVIVAAVFILVVWVLVGYVAGAIMGALAL